MTHDVGRPFPRLRRVVGVISRYGTALLVLGVGSWVFFIVPGISQVPGAGVLIFVMAILISAGLGGLGPGLMITAIGALIGTSAIQSTGHILRNALFTLVGVTISVMVELLQAARRRMKIQSETFEAIRSEER